MRIKLSHVVRCLLICRIALGGLFLFGGLLKVHQPYAFLASVYDYELVGPQLGILVAILLPWVELFVGICLLGGFNVGGALLISAGMSLMFTYVLYSAIGRGLMISCGCLGDLTAQDTVDYTTVLRAGIMFIVSIVAYFSWLYSLASTRRQSLRSEAH